MSLMAMSASRSSVFTFESTVHSSHVLLCLDEQRRRDTFCDVTVVVEAQSFRAHRSVLASCSEYFSHRVSALAQHGAVITLPQEVTAAGFEPLLKFAYTSKLHFKKDNVLEVRNSASVLGFRDLDEACFDFLLPKFFSKSKASAPFPRKTCCKNTCKRRLSKGDRDIDRDEVLLADKEVKPVADSPSQQEVAWTCNKSESSDMGSHNSTSTLTPVPEKINNNFIQCPKYRKFQLACGKESYVMEKRLHSAATVTRDECDLVCTPCTSRANSNNETEMEFPEDSTSNSTRPSKEAPDDPWKTEIHDKNTGESIVEARGRRWETHAVMKDERGGKWDEKASETDILRTGEEMEHAAGRSCLDRSSVKAGSVGSSMVLGARLSGLILYRCPFNALDEDHEITRSLLMDIREGKNARKPGAPEPASVHQKAEEQKEAEEKGADNSLENTGNGGQTGTTAREPLVVNEAREESSTEVAENLAKTTGSDVGPSQADLHNPGVGSVSDAGSERVQSASPQWLKHVNLCSGSSGDSRCPFLQDVDPSKCLLKGAGLSECEGASQSGVSSLNSGEDGDSETETEGDSESYARERARQVQLPFSVDWIVDLSRNDFQHLLKQQAFTSEQLEFVHDMRRRSKNRLAAQRCRKRKLDCIHNLQCEIQKLKTEKEKLLMERSQLSQQKLKICHSVSGVCQRVCNEVNLRPEQVQVLAKFSSLDCPLASFCPHIDTLLSQPRLPEQPESSVVAFEETSSSSRRDRVTGDGQYRL